MKSMMRRTTFREIKNSFGRFAAILAIIALGVGFFSGAEDDQAGYGEDDYGFPQ